MYALSTLSMRSFTRSALAIIAIGLAFVACRTNADEPSSDERPEAILREVNEQSDAARRFAEAKAGQEMAAMRQELELAKQQLAQRQKQLAEFQNQLMQQMAQQGRERAVPSLENAELKIFALKSLPAPHAANAIEDLFGPHAMRVSIDDRSNSLIVLAKPDSIKVIEALLMNLDQKQAKEVDKEQPQPSKTESSRSLLLRLFWLADGLPAQGKDPAEMLPQSVLRATEKLGLVNPVLVTQTVNSLALRHNDPIKFSTNVPALLNERSVELTSSGTVSPADEDRIALTMEVRVFDPGTAEESEIQGSLTMPLGHYMVLGTANSVAREGPSPKTVPRAKKPDDAGPEGEFGIGPAADPAEAATPVQATPPKYSTFRFAFVVQVIEAESFAPDEQK